MLKVYPTKLPLRRLEREDGTLVYVAACDFEIPADEGGVVSFRKDEEIGSVEIDYTGGR